MSNLSPSTLALLRAAKNDAPSKESRNAIWGGVTSGLVTHTPLHITPQSAAGQGVSAAPPPVAAPVGASAAPAAVATPVVAAKGLATAAGLTGMKGAFVGALFGSAISIGVATFMLRTKPAPTPQNEIPRGPVAAQIAQAGTQSGAQSSNAANQNAATNSNRVNAVSATTSTTDIDSLPISTNAGSILNSAGSAGSAASKTSTGNSSHTSTNAGASSTSDDTTKKKSTTAADQNLSPDDMLSREVSLVQEAQRNLQNGDAASALKAVRAARSLEARQLEPEEMSLEARALRALGRDAEATKVESQLRTRYPDQTLGR